MPLELRIGSSGDATARGAPMSERSERAAPTSTIDQVQPLIATVLGAEGLALYDVELADGTLRVLVDREGGVDLQVLSQATRALSAALDAVDPLPGRYVLEVSSPGLERPLRTPGHFGAAVGRRVAIKTVPGTAGDRRVEGELVGVDDGGVSIELDHGRRRVGFGEIERARTVFEWGALPPRADPDGRRGKRKRVRS